MKSDFDAGKAAPHLISISVDMPSDIKKIANHSDEFESSDFVFNIADSFGDFFEQIGSSSYERSLTNYNCNITGTWSKILAAYTCEKLNIPVQKDLYKPRFEKLYEHITMGNYASISESFSPYAYGMLEDIKDFYATHTQTDGWDVFKNLFHDLWEKPVPEKATDEARWLWIRNLILEKSKIDIAPIFYKYHVPLPEGTFIPPAIELSATGDENILIAAPTSLSAPLGTYILKGNEGHTVMYGSRKNDTYYGGQGKDEIRFIDTIRGKDTVYDFDPLSDHITFSFEKGAFPTITQEDNDVVLSSSQNDALTLKNIDVSQLCEQNITFLELDTEDDPFYSHDLKWINVIDFEHAKSRAQELGNDIMFHDESKTKIWHDKKISDLEETDFIYKKHSKISLDDIVKHNALSSASYLEENFMDTWGIMNLLWEDIKSSTEFDLFA